MQSEPARTFHPINGPRCTAQGQLSPPLLLLNLHPSMLLLCLTASDAGLWCQLGRIQHRGSHELIQVHIQGRSGMSWRWELEANSMRCDDHTNKKECCVSEQRLSLFNRGSAIWQLHSAFTRALMSSCWQLIRSGRSVGFIYLLIYLHDGPTSNLVTLFYTFIRRTLAVPTCMTQASPSLASLVL